MIKRLILILMLFSNVFSLPVKTYFTNAVTNTNMFKRIVIIADIHADYDRFNKILQNADILDKNLRWIANKNTLIVQLGDQIDRKAIDKHDINDNHHFRLTYYTDYLKDVARNHSSDFISVIGNHELMNIDKIKNKNDVRNIIAYRPVLFKFDKYLFCHGGFTKKHYDMLKYMRKDIYDINIIWRKYVLDKALTFAETKILDNLILNTSDSILYIRKELDTKELLHNLNIEYLFVGHSETANIHLKNKVWYLDQMLKTSFDNRNYNYIDIIDDNIYIRSLKYD